MMRPTRVIQLVVCCNGPRSIYTLSSLYSLDPILVASHRLNRHASDTVLFSFLSYENRYLWQYHGNAYVVYQILIICSLIEISRPKAENLRIEKKRMVMQNFQWLSYNEDCS